jgi:cytochrome c oxidase subunit IV
MRRDIAETARATEPRAVAQEPELAAHPGPRQYVSVAVVLAIATAFEVGLYYLDLPHALLASLLLFFAIIKFSLVALWFMHLRFDSKIFRRLFVTGLILAVAVYLIVLTIFGALNAPWLLVIVGALVVLGASSLLATTRQVRQRLRAEYLTPEAGQPEHLNPDSGRPG